MSQKHFLRKGILIFLVLGLLLILTVSCSKSGGVPDGVYSCIEADTGEMYTFSGRDVRVTLFIMGNITENHLGTYRLKDGTISFEFPTDDYGIYGGTFSFEAAEDGSYIVIDGVTFKKETVGREE